MSGGGDSYYINEARRIQDNVQQLLLIASELGSGGDASGGWLKGRLSEAKSLANETHQMLKRFGVTASESSASSTERGQRRDTYKKLNRRYQAALKTLDESAQTALRSDQGSSKYRSTNNSHRLPNDLASTDGMLSLYPESAMGGGASWDSDDLSSQASSAAAVQQATRGYNNGNGAEDGRYRRRGGHNEGRKVKTQQHRQSHQLNGYNPHPLEPYPQNSSRDDFYRVAQPQLDPLDVPQSRSLITDSPHHVPLHQQILTYPPPRRSGIHSNGFDNSAVELKDATAGTSSTATGTLRSGSMGSQRDLEFYPVHMVRPDELQARLLAEEAHGVLQIEKDVKGIRQLYQEMAWQVTNEADDLDAIESQMRTAVDLSTHSVVDLRDANTMFQSHRRLKWYLVGSLTVIFVLMALWITTRFL